MAIDLHHFSVFAAETHPRTNDDRYREWSRQEIMDTMHGKADNDEANQVMTAGVAILVVVGFAVMMSWLRS